MTHRLLIARSAFLRIQDRLPQDIEIVCLDSERGFLLAGEALAPSDVRPTLLRLDWDLMQSGRMQEVVQIIREAESLDFVQTSAAGLDNPLFRIVEQRAGAFCNSDAQAPPIAEFVVASVLNRWHRFDLRAEHQQAQRWQGNSFREMIGSHWLIIGFGNIGQRIARQVKGFGASVTAVRRNPDDAGLADDIVNLDGLAERLPRADVVVLATALNDQTHGMADAAFFEQMKSDAVLVNIARGALVEEPALLQALDDGQLDAAILDVFETEPLPEGHPFWTHARVQVTPHASNRGLGTLDRGDALFLENLQRFLAGRPLRNLVNVD